MSAPTVSPAPTASTTAPDAPAGLRGVVVTTTELGDVRGEEGFFHYRQYSAVDLARTRTVEDVWFLLHRGHLPSVVELAAFQAEVAPLRVLPPALVDALPVLAAAGGSPLAGLRTALSLLGAAEGVRPVLDLSPEQRAADALRVCAVVPTVLAALHRTRAGLPPVAPRDDLDAAANWLWMLTGVEAPEAHVRAVRRYLVATVDHGFNASTFTARVVASTGADVVAAVVAALGAFSGPLHGGAPDRALDALGEIGHPDRAAAWVHEQLAAGRRVMGFGHAVYRTLDPRSVLLRETALELGGDLAELAVAVEERVVAALAEAKPGRALHANVEYYAGVVMATCGLAPELFTPTFATSRVVGWCAHVLEQAEDPRIIRPSARYTGPAAPVPVP
ncbi:citrate/2-methylcitrate synthase [Kineococcus sp. DHX-1]|uniref:citrate/2-methylcitrate synthase n=1 Tax=Kineococcus sp. DHX-1 TaxID=3349638 RepID=UPI0036D2C451